MVASGTAFLLDLGVLTAAAPVFSLLFVRIKLPVVSAQILAGMVVGLYVLGWVVDTSIITQISSVGIVLLLFILGLELDPLELQRVAGRALLLTLAEVVVAFAFSLAPSYLLGLGLVPLIGLSVLVTAIV